MKAIFVLTILIAVFAIAYAFPSPQEPIPEHEPKHSGSVEQLIAVNDESGHANSGQRRARSLFYYYPVYGYYHYPSVYYIYG